MNVFVTGATGFIGSHFIRLLTNEGHSVKALRRSKLSQTRIFLDVQPDWTESSLDCLSSSHFEGIDVLVHLAAHSANYPYDTLQQCLRWNLSAPLKVFETACKVGVTKYLAVGSCFEYGLSSYNYQFIPASAPLLPVQTYPASKAAASTTFIQWAFTKGVSLTIARPFQVYGEGEVASRLWPTLINFSRSGRDLPLTFGEQIRDFVHVTDLSKMLLNELYQLINQPDQIKIMNLGSGRPRTIRDFAEKIWADNNAAGSLRFGELDYRENELMRCVPDLDPMFLHKHIGLVK